MEKLDNICGDFNQRRTGRLERRKDGVISIYAAEKRWKREVGTIVVNVHHHRKEIAEREYEDGEYPIDLCGSAEGRLPDAMSCEK